MAFDKQLKIENAYEKYEKNKKLVDFNEIPEDLMLPPPTWGGNRQPHPAQPIKPPTIQPSSADLNWRGQSNRGNMHNNATGISPQPSVAVPPHTRPIQQQPDYRPTQHNEIKQLNTKIYKIIEL